VFQARLDRAFNNLIEWEVSLPVAGGWIWMIPSNPNHVMIL